MKQYSLKEIEKTLSALAERNRLRILSALHYRPMAVCEIREVLGLSFSTVSRHLSILTGAGLIDFNKDGKWVHYRLNLEPESELTTLVNWLLQQLTADEIFRKDLEKARQVDKNLICRVNPLALKKNLIHRRNKS
ncbi:MAG: ArsR/SmtB family transcription factor [Candidatus Saccharicenans sp.]|uniref:ArsR/SmtB family transcription factor n=1 Tax=Candidatus Saccharicenans sp. TaxID=2819258 RepID=UPI00404AC3A7